MIIEDEKGIYDIPDDNTYEEGQSSPNLTRLAHGPIFGFTDVLDKDMEIHNRLTHTRLKEDLIEHIWQKFSTQQHQPDQEWSLINVILLAIVLLGVQIRDS